VDTEGQERVSLGLGWNLKVLWRMVEIGGRGRHETDQTALGILIWFSHENAFTTYCWMSDLRMFRCQRFMKKCLPWTSQASTAPSTSKPLGGIINHRFPGSTHWLFDSLGMVWGLRISISDMFSGDAGVSLWISPWEQLLLIRYYKLVALNWIQLADRFYGLPWCFNNCCSN
jgi:hypothetical protein